VREVIEEVLELRRDERRESIKWHGGSAGNRLGGWF